MSKKVVDLTFPIEEGMTTFPVHWHPFVEITQLGRHGIENRETRKIVLGTHTGTHCDAPSHFIPGGETVDSIPPERFIGPALLLDCSDLDDLNSLVVDTYSNELSRIEAVAEREDKWQQKALLYLAVGNDDAALEVLKDAFFNRYFRSDTISEEDFFKCCFDLELTNDEYRQRAERDLERKENLKGVFKDFGRIGYTDKQYEVIDTLIDEGGSNKDIFNLNEKIIKKPFLDKLGNIIDTI